MKATGIVRRIDDLGRIVLPKEVRRMCHIKEGDPLEIFVGKDTTGRPNIVLNKYSMIGAFDEMASAQATALARTIDCTIIITDTEETISVSGANAPKFRGKYISDNLKSLIEKDKPHIATAKSDSFIEIINSQTPIMEDYMYQAVYPISCQGDIIGAVIALSTKEPIDIKMLKMVANAISIQCDPD